MAIESIATIQSNSKLGNSSDGRPIGISPTNRTLCVSFKSRKLDIIVPPTTAINSAGNGNVQHFELNG